MINPNATPIIFERDLLIRALEIEDRISGDIISNDIYHPTKIRWRTMWECIESIPHQKLQIEHLLETGMSYAEIVIVAKLCVTGALDDDDSGVLDITMNSAQAQEAMARWANACVQRTLEALLVSDEILQKWLNARQDCWSKDGSFCPEVMDRIAMEFYSATKQREEHESIWRLHAHLVAIGHDLLYWLRQPLSDYYFPYKYHPDLALEVHFASDSALAADSISTIRCVVDLTLEEVWNDFDCPDYGFEWMELVIPRLVSDEQIWQLNCLAQAFSGKHLVQVEGVNIVAAIKDYDSEIGRAFEEKFLQRMKAENRNYDQWQS